MVTYLLISKVILGHLVQFLDLRYILRVLGTLEDAFKDCLVLRIDVGILKQAQILERICLYKGIAK